MQSDSHFRSDCHFAAQILHMSQVATSGLFWLYNAHRVSHKRPRKKSILRNTQHGTHIAMPSPFQLAPSSPTVQLHLPDGRALTGPRGGEGGSRDACQQGADRNIAGVDQQRNPAGRVFGEARETTCENGKVIWP